MFKCSARNKNPCDLATPRRDGSLRRPYQPPSPARASAPSLPSCTSGRSSAGLIRGPGVMEAHGQPRCGCETDERVSLTRSPASTGMSKRAPAQTEQRPAPGSERGSSSSRAAPCMSSGRLAVGEHRACSVAGTAVTRSSAPRRTHQGSTVRTQAGAVRRGDPHPRRRDLEHSLEAGRAEFTSLLQCRDSHGRPRQTEQMSSRHVLDGVLRGNAVSMKKSLDRAGLGGRAAARPGPRPHRASAPTCGSRRSPTRRLVVGRRAEGGLA